MRRANHLFEQVVAWDNLRLAVHKALRGKRSRVDARVFVSQLDENLERTRNGLFVGDVPLGVYRQFTIFDPKERLITAPCFAERVLHHAIMNLCEPVFERWLIADTFACRKHKGRLAALQRAQEISRRFGFFLKLDIREPDGARLGLPGLPRVPRASGAQPPQSRAIPPEAERAGERLLGR